jgi:hypothetical protein
MPEGVASTRIFLRAGECGKCEARRKCTGKCRHTKKGKEQAGLSEEMSLKTRSEFIITDCYNRLLSIII